jgi:hypothetical protein
VLVVEEVFVVVDVAGSDEVGVLVVVVGASVVLVVVGASVVVVVAGSVVVVMLIVVDAISVVVDVVERVVEVVVVVGSGRISTFHVRERANTGRVVGWRISELSVTRSCSVCGPGVVVIVYETTSPGAAVPSLTYASSSTQR